MSILRLLSHIHKGPIIGNILKKNIKDYKISDIRRFRKTQRIAIEGAKEISRIMRPGITEKEAANLLDTYLKDHGVKNFLHYSFAWFGNRTRFDECKNYLDYLPSERKLKKNDVVILDTAPVLEGYPGDIGYSFCLEKNPAFDKAIVNLSYFREKIRSLFEQKGITGAEIYKIIDSEIKDLNYDNIHSKYPLGILGHRMHPMPYENFPAILKPCSWQAYWSILSKGFATETLGDYHESDLDGLWAIEPHLGDKGFGVKFEEMLWVKNGKAEWIEEKNFYESTKTA